MNEVMCPGPHSSSQEHRCVYAVVSEPWRGWCLRGEEEEEEEVEEEEEEEEEGEDLVNIFSNALIEIGF